MSRRKSPVPASCLQEKKRADDQSVVAAPPKSLKLATGNRANRKRLVRKQPKTANENLTEHSLSSQSGNDKIKESVVRATRSALALADGKAQLFKRGPNAFNDLKSVYEAAFAMMKHRGAEILSDPKWLDAMEGLMLFALHQGDSNFFVRLGRALKQTDSQFPILNKVDAILIRHWMPQGEGKFGLCNCTDEALTDFCSLVLNNPGLSVASVIKRRQRIGLIKAQNVFVTGAKLVGRKMIFSFK